MGLLRKYRTKLHIKANKNWALWVVFKDKIQPLYEKPSLTSTGIIGVGSGGRLGWAAKWVWFPDG